VPEGHTIHRLARDQRRDLVGRPVRASSPQGRFAAGAARLDGQVPLATDAWGKHLFHTFASGDVLHVHLGLIGRFRRRTSPPPEPVGAVRLRMAGAASTWDLSGPIVCAVVTPDRVDEVVGALGPDPLRPDADAEAFVATVARRAAPIGALLLDQRVVAGIGNVYRAELCFLAGIHPATPGRDLTVEQITRLWDLAGQQLRLGVRRNRIVTVDPAELGVPPSRVRRADATYVYHRDRCGRCGTPTEVVALAGRRTWACPAEQPRPG